MSKAMMLGKAIKFNPAESIAKGSQAKKVPMGMLTEFQRKINGFEFSEYNSGPKFRNGDTLVAKITPCLENGKTAFVDILKDDEIAFGSSEFIVLRRTEYTDSEFIYYLARSPLFRERAVSCMEGTSGRKRVNENALKNLEFVFPDLPAQKSIAKVLSDLDAKIELNNRINRELESMAKTLYDYWFVQFDFPIENISSPGSGEVPAGRRGYKSSGGKMVYNTELKREIPEGWEVDNLLSICKLEGGGTPSKKNQENWSGNIPFYTPTDFTDTVFTGETQEFITEEGLKNCSSKLFQKGTIFLTARGTVGNVVITSRDSAMNQSCYAFCPNPDIHYGFLFFCLKSIIKNLKAKSGGSVFNSIVSNDIKQAKLPIPPINIIETYSNISGGIFESILINYKQNQQLSELRDWLLPMLMNGQVTIKEAEENPDYYRESMAAEPRGEYKKG